MTFLKEPELIFLYTDKSFTQLKVLLFTSYPIQHYSFDCIHLSGSKYSYVSITIQLNINHLFIRSKWSNSSNFNNLI